jgi:TRAP transporter TAXI family solute receptor
MKAKITLLLLTFVILSFSSANAQLAILSGPSQGSYYQFVSDIENVLSTDSTKLIINTETNGAAYNFEKLADKNSPYKLALIQSDLLYTMHGMDMVNNSEKTKNIKVILPLANEQIHLVTLKNSKLTKLQDLSKKMVGIGTKDQGTYFTSSLIKDRSRVFWNSRTIAYEDALQELAQGNIDAFFMVGSAPLEKLDINPQAFAGGLKFLPLQNFDDWAKNYQDATIHASDYKWLEEDIPTFSVKTLLIVNEAKLSDQDRKDIAEIIKGINANQDKLKSNGHHKWKEIDLSDWNSNNWPIYE